MPRLLLMLIVAVIGIGLGCKRRATLSDPKITNGKSIEQSEFPAVIALEESGSVICTASFITPTVVITAAHCLNGDYDAEGVPKVLNVSYKKTKAKRALRHPKYFGRFDPTKDIAVIEFPAGLAEGVLEIAAKAPQAKDEVSIIGFGCNNASTRQGSGVKRIGTNSVLEILENGTIKLGGAIKPINSDGENAASCTGDSGGPMLLDGKIVGLTTGGKIDEELKSSEYHNVNTSESRSFLKRAIEKGFNIPLQ